MIALILVVIMGLTFVVLASLDLRNGARAELGVTAEEKSIGRASGYAIATLKETYVHSEDMEADEFERRLDAILSEQSISSEEGILLVQASACMLGQSSAAVLGHQDLIEYGTSLKFAGVEMDEDVPLPAYEAMALEGELR